MPAVRAVSILAMSGRSELEAGERVRAAGEVVEGDAGAALAVLGDHVLQQLAVRAALGLDQLEADPRRVGAEAADDRPRGAHRALDVQDRARVEVDEEDLAGRQDRHADLERRGAGPVVEGEERVVGLGGGDQLRAAQLDRAEHPAHQRLAAVGQAVVQVDDRLEVRLHLAVREELGEPVGARAVQQRLGRDRQPDSSARRTANRQARSESESAFTTDFSRSSQPGPASRSPCTPISPEAGSEARCSTL